MSSNSAPPARAESKPRSEGLSQIVGAFIGRPYHRSGAERQSRCASGEYPCARRPQSCVPELGSDGTALRPDEFVGHAARRCGRSVTGLFLGIDPQHGPQGRAYVEAAERSAEGVRLGGWANAKRTVPLVLSPSATLRYGHPMLNERKPRQGGSLIVGLIVGGFLGLAIGFLSRPERADGLKIWLYYRTSDALLWAAVGAIVVAGCIYFLRRVEIRRP